MQTVSNYDGIITIPSKMNDLTREEVNFMFPNRKHIPNLPPGVTYEPDKPRPYSIRKTQKQSVYYLGYFKTFIEAIEALEKYCTEHKLKLF